MLNNDHAHARKRKMELLEMPGLSAQYYAMKRYYYVQGKASIKTIR